MGVLVRSERAKLLFGMEKSRVFLSWSGERSKAVAIALRSWLKKVLQAVEPWMAEEDIKAGQVWFNQIADTLEVSTFAVICVTPENLESRWLNFEAGAIGMTRRDGAHRAAAPYLLGLEFGDLPQPLAAFEAKQATKNGTLALVKAINDTLPTPLPEPDLVESFEMWWPKLSDALDVIPEADETAVEGAERPDRDLLEEILTHVRQIQPSRAQMTYLVRPEELPPRLPEIDIDAVIRTVQDLLATAGIDPSDADVHVSTGQRRVTITLAGRVIPTIALADLSQVIAGQIGLEVAIFK